MYSTSVWSACRPLSCDCHRCACVETKPGETILLAQSITLADAGAGMSASILAILSPSMSRSALVGTTLSLSSWTRRVPPLRRMGWHAMVAVLGVRYSCIRFGVL
jgi:hypothetical protein